MGCHLLIGPPTSGKTTLAGVLADLAGAVVLSTDSVRGELFGDAAGHGPWRDIEALLHRRIRQAVAAGIPVIVDATQARRCWRLASLVAVVPTHQRDLQPLLRDELARLDQRIRSARIRETRFVGHGYSSPQALREEHQHRLEEALAVYRPHSPQPPAP